MEPNPLKARLDRGEAVYGTMIQEVRNPSVVQLMRLAGCDFLFFDMEHGPLSLETVSDLIRVARLAGIVPLVRVPHDQYPFLVTPLDAGARGIMIPRVETREQVERLVECMMYPPVGNRGCSVTKGHNDFADMPQWQFAEQANRENLVIIQIERKRAVEHVDELLSVPGVGAAFLGPNDLALSLGTREADQLKALEQPIQHVLDSARAHKIPCGIHLPNLEWLIEWQRRGMQIITYSSDIGFLKTGAETGIKKLKAAADHGT